MNNKRLLLKKKAAWPPKHRWSAAFLPFVRIDKDYFVVLVRIKMITIKMAITIKIPSIPFHIMDRDVNTFANVSAGMIYPPYNKLDTRPMIIPPATTEPI